MIYLYCMIFCNFNSTWHVSINLGRRREYYLILTNVILLYIVPLIDINILNHIQHISEKWLKIVELWILVILTTSIGEKCSLSLSLSLCIQCYVKYGVYYFLLWYGYYGNRWTEGVFQIFYVVSDIDTTCIQTNYFADKWIIRTHVNNSLNQSKTYNGRQRIYLHYSWSLTTSL